MLLPGAPLIVSEIVLQSPGIAKLPLPGAFCFHDTP
jgi:hypothetical protein